MKYFSISALTGDVIEGFRTSFESDPKNRLSQNVVTKHDPLDRCGELVTHAAVFIPGSPRLSELVFQLSVHQWSITRGPWAISDPREILACPDRLFLAILRKIYFLWRLLEENLSGVTLFMPSFSKRQNCLVPHFLCKDLDGFSTKKACLKIELRKGQNCTFYALKFKYRFVNRSDTTAVSEKY